MKRQTLIDLGLSHFPLIVGHRGACGHAPENTLPSLSLAVEHLADMVELDLHLTLDGELIASHDSDLTRTSGVGLLIEENDYGSLCDINVASYLGDYPPTMMPRLEEVFATIPRHVPINLELKSTCADPRRYVAALQSKLTRGGILISSFDWNLLREVRHILPEIAVAPLADGNADELAKIALSLTATSAHCNYETITPAIVQDLDSDGVPVLVYTVNDVTTAMEMLAIGVRGVFTNFPGEFVGHFGLPEGRIPR